MKYTIGITGVLHSPYKTAHNIRNAPYKTENPRFKGPFQTVFVYPSCSRPTPGHNSVHFRAYFRIFPSIFHSLVSRKNGSFAMFNVVILMTLRHYTFNGWMDWGLI